MNTTSEKHDVKHRDAKRGTTPKAYVMSDRSGYVEHAHVVFATTARDARKHGGIDNVTYVDLAARRAPEFDEYAKTGVPLAALLEAGWWWECGGCRKMLHDDDEGIITNEDKFEVYCSAECEGLSTGRDRGYEFQKREREQFEAEVKRRFECGTVWAFWNGLPYGQGIPSDGFRLSVRVKLDDRYGTFWDGDAAIEWDC